MPRVWPGYLAVWAAIILHFTWVGLLLVPGTRAFDATPVHEVYGLCGYSAWRTALLLAFVAGAATVGFFRRVPPGVKVLYLFPQQLVLGISAAGAVIAIYESAYADGVLRPSTFIAADQAAVILTWFGHTAALVLLYLIHARKMAPSGGTNLPVGRGDVRG
jgi:hypothetical protein